MAAFVDPIVLVAAGQYVQRQCHRDVLKSPLDLAEIAARRAIEEIGPANMNHIDTVAWIRTFADSSPRYSSPFGQINNPPRCLAHRLGIEPTRAIHGQVGGETPQSMVNEMALRIHKGEIRVALLAGAEANANEVYALSRTHI